MDQTSEIKVFISGRKSKCDECKEDLGHHAWITLDKKKGALCLACADLDHLVYLAAGNAALSRRARRNAVLFAIVLKWSHSRKRYERQGILVEEEALEMAESECLADEESRARRQEREAERRAESDRDYIEQFARRVRELFPTCPAQREFIIADHACRKYSGRIGRTATAKRFEESAIRLAVIAHIRHSETSYDQLLAKGYDREEARARVEEKVLKKLGAWRRS
jgi:hypothetical protein